MVMRAHAQARERTHAQARERTHVRTHERTHARTHARARARAHTHTHTYSNMPATLDCQRAHGALVADRELLDIFQFPPFDMLVINCKHKISDAHLPAVCGCKALCTQTSTQAPTFD